MNNSILDLITAPWKIQVIYAAIRLNIFTILSGKKLNIDQISSKCLSKPQLLTPLLDACVGMGLLILKSGKYGNTQFSEVYFVENRQNYMGDLIKLQFMESEKWNRLYDIILDKGSKVELEKSDQHKTFIKAMHNLGMSGEATALSNLVDLTGCSQLIDAGGGSGLYSIILCQKYPHLKSTILDKHQTLTVAKNLISGYKVRHRITLREADIEKDAFGENADAVLLSDVIYDKDSALPVLKNAWNCLCKDGLLIIRGYYSDPGNTNPLFGSLFVLNQIVFDPGRKVLTVSNLKESVKNAGFVIDTISPLTEKSIILIARK